MNEGKNRIYYIYVEKVIPGNEKLSFLFWIKILIIILDIKNNFCI